MNTKTITIKVNDEIIAEFKADEETFEKYVGRKPLNGDELGKLVEVATKSLKDVLPKENKLFEDADKLCFVSDFPFIIENAMYQGRDDYRIYLNGKQYRYDHDAFDCEAKYNDQTVSAICGVYKDGDFLIRYCVGIFSDIEAAQERLNFFKSLNNGKSDLDHILEFLGTR